MRDAHLPDAIPTLTAVLERWGCDHPGKESVADAVRLTAEAGARLGRIVAAQPVGDALSDGGVPEPATDAAGDQRRPLDIQAEALFVAALSKADVVAVCSAKTDDPILIVPGGTLVVTLDPIEGSSNIDTNEPIGSIFAVLPANGFEDDPAAALLQPGRRQLAAGIIGYGPATVLAITLGDGTDIYVLDPRSGTFVLTRRHIEVPVDSSEYAINASNARHWGPGIQEYVKDLVNGELGPRERDFTMRWLASLVAEAYRILLRGGIFLSPADARPGYESGHLRLVFEANPVAFLCEQAGASATDGITPILDLRPSQPHQRTPLVFGSRNKVERVLRYLQGPQPRHEQSPLFSRRGLFRA